MAKVAHKEFSLASTAYRKPVFIFGRRFASITAAAEYSVGPHASAKSLKAEQVQIQKWCNADNVEGVYWSN